jgi:hypothetical protein
MIHHWKHVVNKEVCFLLNERLERKYKGKNVYWLNFKSIKGTSTRIGDRALETLKKASWNELSSYLLNAQVTKEPGLTRRMSQPLECQATDVMITSGHGKCSNTFLRTEIGPSVIEA